MITVTPEYLNEAANKIQNLASDYKNQYNQLYKETDAMGSAWSGKDNTAFINQISGFREDFEKMNSLMNEYVEFLRKSAKKYSDAQNSIVDSARKLVN